MTPTTMPCRAAVAAGLAALLAACATGSRPAADPEPARTPGPAPAPQTAPPPAAPSRQAPPPPEPLQPLEFPPFHEFRLDNGLPVLVVEKHDVPIANVALFVKSGTATEPVEKMGLAGLTAELLDSGTRTRTAREIAETVEGVGGRLDAGAGLDFVSVSAEVLSTHLPLAMELVADVTRNPTFPDDEVATAKQRTLTGLQVALSEPNELARRRFLREIYGEGSGYAGAPLPETVREITRADLRRFHQQHFRADNALLVVSGDVDPQRVRELAQRHLGGWRSAGAVSEVRIDPPARGPARITLIHRPGSVQSSIRVGNVGIRPDNPDYYPLQVMNKILGGGTDARLFLILREERGWTYGAYSSLSRPREVGHFSAGAEVRTEVTDSALVELLRQLRRMREEPVSQEELEAAKSFLMGSFPLRIETAGQIASQVAQNRLLGLPDDALTGYRERIARVTAADVQRVARQYVLPDQAAIVVVGDATRVLDQLEAVAPVVLLNTRGEPLDRAALEVRAPTERLDASGLEPVTLEYAVMFQGNPVGSATVALAREGDAWLGTQTLQAGPTTQRSEVRFTDTLTPLSLNQSVQAGPMNLATQLRVENGRVTGTAQLPPQMGGERQVDAEVVAGTLLPGMDAFVMAAAELAEGKTLTLPIFSVQSGSATPVTFTVTGRERVTVPAGTFDALRVEVSGGEQSSTVLVRAEAPHHVLRQILSAQPVSLELRSIRP